MFLNPAVSKYNQEVSTLQSKKTKGVKKNTLFDNDIGTFIFHIVYLCSLIVTPSLAKRNDRHNTDRFTSLKHLPFFALSDLLQLL